MESSEAMLDDLKLAGLPGDCEASVISVGDLPKSNPQFDFRESFKAVSVVNETAKMPHRSKIA